MYNNICRLFWLVIFCLWQGVRFTDRIGVGDLDTKLRAIRRFLEDAHPVNLTCRKRRARAATLIAKDKAAEGKGPDWGVC